jgi:hypothetical protein
MDGRSKLRECTVEEPFLGAPLVLLEPGVVSQYTSPYLSLVYYDSFGRSTHQKSINGSKTTFGVP